MTKRYGTEDGWQVGTDKKGNPAAWRYSKLKAWTDRYGVVYGELDAVRVLLKHVDDNGEFTPPAPASLGGGEA